MAKYRRVALGLIAFVLIVALAIIFLSYRLLTKSLPVTDGKLSLNILEKPVHVYRDSVGVPHIFAENRSDLFRAAGYVTAQDRLWQMDFNRRVAAGRLSEIFGASAVESDKFIRTWGFNRMAQKIANILSAESRHALEAYAEGVNAFINTHLDCLPLEFSLLNYEPEPWRIEDSLAFGRFMAWKLSFSWYIELVLDRLMKKLGPRKAREIFPGFPKEGPVIIPANTRPFWTQVHGFLNAGLQLRDFLGVHSAQLGSNSWVVAGAKSACGAPLLANDPHLELMTPSLWYEMHLSCADFDVAGVALPGNPVILIGHNENIAWGLTNGMVDDVDFYLEKVHPQNAKQYWNGQAWADFESVEEEILVRNGQSTKLEILFSRNGPIISKLHPLLREQQEVVSMRWTGHQPSDEVATLLKLQRARNWQDFTNALRDYQVPAQNFVFAAVDGDIGYYLGGRIPIRKNATGILPHRGWLDEGQWQSDVPFEKLPHILNPPENYIVTANNKIVSDRYPFYITNLWEPSSRAARIHQLLAERDSLTVEDFMSMQRDIVSVHAQKILPILLNTVRAELDSTSDNQLRRLYDLIKNWDCEEAPESIAASIFNAFFLKLLENTLKDEMGEELYENYVRLGNVPSRVIVALLEADKAHWFDNVHTQKLESKHDVIVKSLLDAGAMLSGMAGDNISNWKWGELHTLTMSHPLGKRKWLDAVFNLGPYARGGSKMTVNNGEYRFRAPFRAILGASTRQLIDFCDVNGARSVITSGQSGHRMSKHYKDQTPLWLEGRYHRMIMDRKEISQTAPEHLLLTPQE